MTDEESKQIYFEISSSVCYYILRVLLEKRQQGYKDTFILDCLIKHLHTQINECPEAALELSQIFNTKV